jgi:hypothetical protein
MNLNKISQQKFNDYIKDCCEIIELDKPTTITWFTETKSSKYCKKHQLITSHTARKNFYHKLTLIRH